MKKDGNGGIRGGGNERKRGGGIRWKMREVLRTAFRERDSQF